MDINKVSNPFIYVFQMLFPGMGKNKYSSQMSHI